MELERYKNQGISIWLEGAPSTPEEITSVMRVRENSSAYMRDYVFSSGSLSQLRFDRVQEEGADKREKPEKES